MKILELSEYTLYDDYSDSSDESNDYNSPINELNSRGIDYGEFYRNYLLSNKPCLVRSISKDWEAQNQWIIDGKPNFDYLEEKYGSSEIPIANCQERYFNVHARSTMLLKDFLLYWKNYIEEDYPSDLPCLYLKDWHFVNEYPSDSVYRVPFIFASDWINEYSVNCNKDDDYRFVYFGPKGSWTPLHSDVFSSFSWSVNLCGKKKWVFYPPEQDEMLKDKFGNLPYDVRSEEFTDATKYPDHSNLTPITFIQGIGDAIFVPSGWHHQVWNLDDTISINHNWVNACNIDAMWNALNKTFANAQKEISDCRGMGDWDSHSQLMLKLCFGMDHTDFVEFLFYIADVRLQHLSRGSFLQVPGDWLMGGNQMMFDLSRIRQIFQEMIALDVPCLETHHEKFNEFIDEIDSICNLY